MAIRDPQAYAACTTFLIGRTRDQEKYALIFKENCNYGFRRNFVGLRRFGSAITAGAALVLGLRLYGEFSSHQPIAPVMLIFEALNFLFLFCWFFWFRYDWVKVPADEYAERLFEAIELRFALDNAVAGAIIGAGVLLSSVNDPRTGYCCGGPRVTPGKAAT